MTRPCGANKPLAGQKALVTGANSGIGKAVAIALAEAGAAVVVNYVSDPEDALAVPLAVIALGGARIASQGGAGRWMV